MKIEELYVHYGTWVAMEREVGMGGPYANYWRKIGYIPMSAQMMIELRSGGKFKASEADGRPKTRRTFPLKKPFAKIGKTRKPKEGKP